MENNLEIEMWKLPCKQRFLSCMALSIYDVICVACLSVNKPTTWQTSHENDFVNTKSHAGEKPLLAR